MCEYLLNEYLPNELFQPKVGFHIDLVLKILMFRLTVTDRLNTSFDMSCRWKRSQ